MTTAERIKRARLAARLTQDELARKVGVASFTVSRWERGAQEPGRHQYVRIAEATGAQLVELQPCHA